MAKGKIQLSFRQNPSLLNFSIDWTLVMVLVALYGNAAATVEDLHGGSRCKILAGLGASPSVASK
jgi:hypothetical protein